MLRSRLAHIPIFRDPVRIGIPYREAYPLVKDLTNRKSIKVEGIMTTLAELSEFDKEQIRRLRSLGLRSDHALKPAASQTGSLRALIRGMKRRREMHRCWL